MPSSSSSPSPCDLFHLQDMKQGSSCTSAWTNVRKVLHPGQQAVGYAAVKRKIDKDYTTQYKAQHRMNTSNGVLPFVLGPNNIPYLIDSHHTASALEASGHHSVTVTLKKICDWSHMAPDEFFRIMEDKNFLCGVGRDNKASVNTLPRCINVSMGIPNRLFELRDDPWRSLAALVRQVKNQELRGYLRDCQANGHMTPFFEFRWAYFFNDAYQRGCDSSGSFWDSASECRQFETAYQTLLAQNQNTTPPDFTTDILQQDSKAWQELANLLVPLCRGQAAQDYVLPLALKRPMGGANLPGRVAGKDTPILKKDPDCAPPKCPTMPTPVGKDGFVSACKE